MGAICKGMSEACLHRLIGYDVFRVIEGGTFHTRILTHLDLGLTVVLGRESGEWTVLKVSFSWD